MTINYYHTNVIVPKLIEANKELFINEIMASKENVKNFIENDSYLKANLQTDEKIVLEEINFIKYEYGNIYFASFFANYVINSNDTKVLIFLTYKGSLKYYKLDASNCLYEMGSHEELKMKFAKLDKDLIIEFLKNNLSDELKVKAGVSNRHVHLTKDDLAILFGSGFILEKDRDLIQPGEFASKEYVTIKTKFNQIEHVRVLGPTRNYTQVEISRTDAYKLKVNPPIRNSGDLKDASEITIVGPKGEVTKNALIIANRHIHLNEYELKKYGLNPDKIYKVKVNTDRGGILYDVHLKIDSKFVFELHVDTDDANAFLIKSGDELEIIK